MTQSERELFERIISNIQYGINALRNTEHPSYHVLVYARECVKEDMKAANKDARLEQ